MKKRNVIKYGIFFVIGSVVVFLNAACNGALVSRPDVVAETAVPTKDTQIIAERLPETANPPPPATPTMIPTMTATAALSVAEVAVIEPIRPLPTIKNSPDLQFVQMAEQASVPLVVVDGSNTDVWQYPEDTFVHPVALGLSANMAYIIDAGRVLALNLAQPTQADVLLQAGDVVEAVGASMPASVVVIEPLDLHVAPDGLLVLDRAGDVYRYDWQGASWLLDWYDRPISDTSSHYYVALDGEENGRYLLETSYNYALLYENSTRQYLWNLPEGRGIDLSVAGESVYVLAQAVDDTSAALTLYQATRKVDTFQPNFVMDQARQVVAVGQSVYSLDMAGKRLLQFSAPNSQLQTIFQLPSDGHISAFAVHPESGKILFAGKNRIYFFEQPAQSANVPGQALLTGIQPHDPDFLASISGFAPPIGWNISPRDLQMPGAPRHYRLGVHQGADFYWARDSQVFAAADGVIVRAMHDYVPPFPAAFYDMRNQSYELGYTSEEALDFYRGQQVWLAHEDGLISRYIHLSSIAWDLVEGQSVKQGQFIGTVGNSGSPASLESPDSDAHLHFELWLGDAYLGQFLRPVETRFWLESILHDQKTP